MIALKPLPGRILVELREKYSNVATPDLKYDTKTSGICIDCADPLFKVVNGTKPAMYMSDGSMENLKGKLVFWEEYKDGAVVERDGKKYAFIKIEDLDGYEDVEA